MNFYHIVVKASRIIGNLLLLLTLCGNEAHAQSHIDSSDAQARRVFDLPGNTGADPNETLEYLDELSTATGKDIERIHANADVSWNEAYRELRLSSAHSSLRSDTSATFSLRSRASSPLYPNEEPAYALNEYVGSPNSLYNRIQIRSSALEIGALEQKQSGEASFTDHLAGFLELRNAVPITSSLSIEKAVAGDYMLAFGNGLMFGGGLASSKGLHPAFAVEERSSGLRGTMSESAKELRGGAIQLASGPMYLLVFASDRSFDANVTGDTIRTIFSSSYHRTQSELAEENAASATVIGARTELSTSDTASLYLKGGATIYELHYRFPFVGTANAPFIGSQLDMAGLDALAIGGAWTALAEAAHSTNDTSRETALLCTAIFNPATDLAFSLLYRHIPYRFSSPFGELSGLSASLVSDLDGYYTGLELSPIPGILKVCAYGELKSAIVPVENIFGNQHDYLVAAYYHATDALELNATARDQENANYLSDTGYVTLQGQTLNIRLEAIYRPLTNASLHTRFEHVRYALTTSENGWQASEEARIKIPTIATDVTLSASRFQTASSRSAIASYEEGSPGAAIINSLDGLGWRIALRAKLRPATSIAVSAYLAGTIYDLPRTLGSGATAHTGTSDFTATAQLDVTL